jgi:rhamnose utilization protein RhaD (predicted bifunctional aldolase and dehydrogenase)
MKGAATATNASRYSRSEVAPLLELSARIGRDPSLVQASTGNTSIKLNGVLWIKASGKWLADAERDEIFVPVNLADAGDCLRQNRDLPEADAGSAAGRMRPSIETFMHAALHHRVVIHVHSVNTIAWGVRRDAQAQLKERLSGLRWRWIPFIASGLPLAQEIRKVVSHCPDADVFVLGNHGLLVCGQACNAAEDLLWEVERRLAISPRVAPEPRRALLAQFGRVSRWRPVEEVALHALGTDPSARRILKGGILYACQAIFLGRTPPMMPCSVPFSEVTNGCGGRGGRPFLIVEGSGVMTSDRITRTEFATLAGLVEVVQRIGASVPIRYLTESEVAGVLSGDGYNHRESADNNAHVTSSSRTG